MTEDANTPDRSADRSADGRSAENHSAENYGAENRGADGRNGGGAPEQWWARPSGALSRPSDVPGGAPTDPTGHGLPPVGQAPLDRSGQGSTPPHTSVYPVQSYGQTSPGQYGQSPAGFGYQQPSGNYPTGSYPLGSYSGGGFGGTGRPTAVLSPQPHDPKNGRAKRSTAVVATAVILGIGAAFGAGYLGSQVGSPSTANAADSSLTQTSTSAPVSAKVESGSVTSVADAVLPSVVSVIATNGQSMDEGSGIILSADGQILTNNHVVAGAQEISVRFNDGSTASATLVGGDATDDLAVIKAKGVSGLTPATLGSSANLQVGQSVVAIGSPLGLSATVTSGIVSALNRPVRTQSEQEQQQQQPWGSQGQDPTQQDPTQQDPTQQDPTQQDSSGSADTVLNAIQTDAAINPGNSGGALVDMDGKVIGINSAIASMSDSSSGQAGNIGVGFAIPIDQAKRIADEIIKNGFATHAVLGASVQSASTADQLNSTGAQIASVTDGGAAAKAGLKQGDVVTKVGSQTIESSDALVAAIRSQAPGGTVDITYLRNSQSTTVKVTLGSAKSE
ncbi:S1C family serine protease [Nakamurella lactea]|uniref:S1C family serine protease n=1 Tax=Nakamurella lactea TaxID=459515 RepID=UPI0006874459|nr:trypsin-like peptidase domain-containing protein [Nakamurella lactea]